MFLVREDWREKIDVLSERGLEKIREEIDVLS